jgi:uncharacterized protein YndB with AHSA1/START domain
MKAVATTLEVNVSINIKAAKEKIWETITTPELIQQFLFGTTVHTTWKENQPITFEGVWQGKQYKDKGIVLEVVENKTLKHSFWSSLAGKEDKPENYVMVTYEITDKGDECELTITQDGVKDEKELEHLTSNWTKVAEEIKRIAEEL